MHSDLILGHALALLERIRRYFILTDNEEGIEIMEIPYQEIKKMVDEFYYKDRKDGQRQNIE